MFLNLCLLIIFYFKESTIYRSGHGLPRRRCTSSSQSTSSQCGWEPVRVFTTELLPPSPTPDGTTFLIVSLGMGSPTTAARVSVLFFLFRGFWSPLIWVTGSMMWKITSKIEIMPVCNLRKAPCGSGIRSKNCKNAGSLSESANHWGSETGIRNPCFLSYLQSRNIPQFVMLICIFIHLPQFSQKLHFLTRI